ncbi:alpha/beta hydrolase [Aeromicrobium camelliae]|uniref:Alpha/beta hydrolase n=1 Tax=Aeromicrobium camelliae TaxID=1538144 RepID=A0A3N6X6J9_9ACTN|nr:alpha/beta hydrolase [Aeromicrobium camelliae]RQN09278.1 alpha/beta hydrolase [Aeromicrobium camelliae]
MPTLVPHDLTVAGLATRVYEAGDPANDTVIFVHDGAYGTDALLAFGEVAESLSADFHVLLPDLLGWGGSAKVHHFDQSLYAPRLNHIAALCDQLGVTRAHFVGNSFGGSLILRASIAGVWPIRSAVSIAGTGGPWRSQTGITAMADYRATETEARRISDLVVGSDAATEEHVARRLANSLIPGHWESLRAWGLRNPELPATPPPADGYPETLATVSTPILLVAGSRDVMVEPGWQDRIVAAAPAVKAVVMDTGHSPNIDLPGEVEKVLRSFWSQVD